MKHLSFVAAALSSVAFSSVAHCAEALQTTTEFGIPITPDSVFDAIQETGDFWPAVRSHLAGDQCTLADAETREQASAFIKRVNLHLYNRLFGSDDATAYDLIKYVSARLRANTVYRELREILDDDAVLAQAKSQREQAQRLRRALPAGKAAETSATVSEMRDIMKSLGVAEERIELAMPSWNKLADVEARRDATEAGRQMLAFESEIIAGDRKLAELMRSVISAADWAQIVKPEGHFVKRVDFVEACDALARLELDNRTAQKPGVVAD